MKEKNVTLTLCSQTEGWGVDPLPTTAETRSSYLFLFDNEGRCHGCGHTYKATPQSNITVSDNLTLIVTGAQHFLRSTVCTYNKDTSQKYGKTLFCTVLAFSMPEIGLNTEDKY
jgi:hypothetical protein